MNRTTGDERQLFFRFALSFSERLWIGLAFSETFEALVRSL
jgi:hypothetical protein